MSDPSNPFATHISYALAAAHRSVHHQMAARLKKHGIQIEAWRVMECLDAGERLTMGALARKALINPPTLSKLVDRMVSDGLVHRQISAQDQREINLLLTNLGRSRMLSIRAEVEDQDTQLTAVLDADDGKTLIRLLSKLAR